MNPRLKKIIYNKLFEDLKGVEIIPFLDSIWFINRENKNWYFEYQSDGTLFYCMDFFTQFFELFSLQEEEYKSIISSFVKDILNNNIKMISADAIYHSVIIDAALMVEVTEVLTPNSIWNVMIKEQVEEIINSHKKTLG